MVVLIAVSNRAVRTQRRHLGSGTHTVLSLSESRPTLETSVSPFQPPSSRELTLAYILLSSMLARIDHLPPITKILLIEIRSVTWRGIPEVVSAAGASFFYAS